MYIYIVLIIEPSYFQFIFCTLIIISKLCESGLMSGIIFLSQLKSASPQISKILKKLNRQITWQNFKFKYSKKRQLPFFFQIGNMSTNYPELKLTKKQSVFYISISFERFAACVYRRVREWIVQSISENKYKKSYIKIRRKSFI